MTWTRNDYFTYFTDGNTQTSHRAADQNWNFTYPGDGRAWVIWTSGTNPQNNQYNAFAKKHLLTVNGGKAGDVDVKLANIHENRRVEDFDSYNASRAKKHSRLTPASQGLYPLRALGGQAMNNFAQGDVSSTLSMIICDKIEPAKLRNAFAKALSNAGLVANTATQHIVVSFGDNKCVCRHDFESNQSTYVNQITVTAFCVSITQHACTAHIVHCSG